jgi:Cysteine-rich secretory protein family
MNTPWTCRGSQFNVNLLCLLIFALALLPITARAIDPAAGPTPQAPPQPPPALFSKPPAFPKDGGPLADPPIMWSIGQPTDEEQLYLEYINRSRANPPAEGARLAATTDPDVLSAYSYFHVDLNLMQAQFNAIPAVPPLAMGVELLQAARLHSGDMYTNQFQGHNGSDGSTLGTRATAQGYVWSWLAENVYATAKSVWYGHAGFNVDWGTGTGGMQTPPGHRNNIHNAAAREVGIGVVDGSNGSVGPQLVTQDFGARQAATPFVTGVVYYDFNGNQFYDMGEGIGGVTVTVPGSGYYAVTADSGGFAVPVTTNGNYAVSFSAPGLSLQTTAQVSGGQNCKLDLVPVYQPPVVSGPNPAKVNQANAYNISVVGAAIGYDWMAAMLAAYTAVEGAESLANVTIVSSPGYSAQAASPTYAGNYSFHLAQPKDPTTPTDQYIYLNTTLRPEAGSTLSYYKMLGWATSTQVARAQVSTNSGGTWVDVWSQAGSGGSGETSFSQASVSLSAFVGLQTRIRFVYDFTGGSYFYQTDPGVGLYLDNIAVSNARFLAGTSTNAIPSGTAFNFIPTVPTNYLLSARAHLSGRVLSWGPSLEISAELPPPSLQLGAKPVLAGGQIQVDFSVSNYRAGMTFQLYKAAAPEGPWSLDGTATLQTVVPSSQFRFTSATGNATRTFYKVSGAF